MTSFRLSGFIVLTLATLLTSCLKEDKCHRRTGANAVLVAVQDTDYDNANEIQQAAALAGGLPFASYVQTLDVRNKSVNDPTKNFRQSVVPGAQDQMVTLSFADHPADRYELIISGNAADENFAPESDYLLDLHPSGTESADIYLGNATLNLPPMSQHIIYLERTKGKLLVLYSNFPQQIATLEVRATGIYKQVAGNKTYSGATQVAKSYQLPDQTGGGRMELMLAPTLPGTDSALQIFLYNPNGDPVRIFSDIPLTIARNHITPLNIRYDPDLEIWEIWIFADGEWVQLHNLTIT